MHADACSRLPHISCCVHINKITPVNVNTILFHQSSQHFHNNIISLGSAVHTEHQATTTDYDLSMRT